MSILDLTAMNAALKELYDDQVVQNLVYRDNPFFAMLKKKTDFEGKYKPIPIITGASQGRSSTFATAQTNQSAVQIESFFLTRKSDYSIAQIDNQTMMASRSNKGAFLEAAKTAIDGAIRSITLSISSSLFRSGTGSIGQISTISTGLITLSDPNSVVQFEKNMVLQANATDGGVSPRAALGYVVAVDRTLGTITVSTSMGGAAASPGSWQAADYLLVQGDLNIKPSGLAAWLPSTAPTSGDNFYGVDRSVDATRLAGVRYDGSAQSIEEALVDASNLLAREGGQPDVCIMSFASYSALIKALGTKVQYIDVEGPAKVAFRGVQITGANSQIKVFPDRNCPAQTAYLLTMSTWSLEGLGEVPMINKSPDGLEMLRVSNADAGELRVSAYYNLATNAPGWNARVSLSA